MATSDWGNFESSNSFDKDWGTPLRSQSTLPPTGGAWHWRLTLLSLLFTTGVAVLASWLMRDIPNRSAVLLGLLFMAPMASLLIVALLLDASTSLMSPWFSRKAQSLLALGLAVVIFGIGCLGGLTTLAYQPKSTNFVFLVDKSDSMGYGAFGGNDITNQRKTAVQNILNTLPDGTAVGLILFSDVLSYQMPLTALDDQVRQKLITALNALDDGSTDFYLPLITALDMIQQSQLAQTNSTRIIMLTDGDAEIYSSSAEIAAQCKQYNATISCVKIGSEPRIDLVQLIQSTGGSSLSVSNAAQLTQTLGTLSVAEVRDVLRADDSTSVWVSLAQFLLTGIALGVGLTLLFSRQHQFRFQLILSPLMGVAAFLVLKVMPGDIAEWLREAMAFSCFGLVVMRANR